MKAHGQMTTLITRAAESLHPALATPLIGSDGALDFDVLRDATTTLDRLFRTRSGPSVAVYVAWDTSGRCRYVGSVHRPRARAAVRARMREHMHNEDRRGTWYALTVLPVRGELGSAVVRECEGRVARRLGPIDGTLHPVPDTDRTLSELISASQPAVVQ